MRQITQGLSRLGLSYIPSFGNFLSVNVGDAARVFQQLLRRGVIVRPVAGYGMPAYLRVSTARQGDSGLGLEAQRATVEAFARQQGGQIAAEYVEVESGKHSERPQLAAALEACRKGLGCGRFLSYQVREDLAAGVSSTLHPFFEHRSRRRDTPELLVVVAGDKGLCGALNTNLLRLVLARYKEWQAAGEDIDVCCIGNKGFGFMNRLGANVKAHLTGLGDTPHIDIATCSELGIVVSADQHPDVPSYAEYPGLDFPLVVTWFGLCAPARTPRDIITRLNLEVSKGLLNNPAMKAKFVTSQGIQSDAPAGGTPEAFGQLIAAEQKRYQELAKITGVKEE